MCFCFSGLHLPMKPKRVYVFSAGVSNRLDHVSYHQKCQGCLGLIEDGHRVFLQTP